MCVCVREKEIGRLKKEGKEIEKVNCLSLFLQDTDLQE